jgi:hypothetical protein
VSEATVVPGAGGMLVGGVVWFVLVVVAARLIDWIERGR